MSTQANPLTSGLVPGGSNPTGAMLDIPGLMPSTSSGANPLLPTVTMSPSSTGSPVTNPFTAGTLPFSANTSGGYASSGGSTIPTSTAIPTTGTPSQVSTNPLNNLSNLFGIGGATTTGAKELYSTLTNVYGKGVGDLISNFLTSGAGYNQQAVNNLLAAMQPGVERGTESLMEQFSTSGNRFGSSSEIGLGDYLSQVNLNEGELISSMYEQSVNNFINVLMGAGSTSAKYELNKPSVWDTISGVLGLTGAGAGALSTAGVGSGGSLGAILGAIAAL